LFARQIIAALEQGKELLSLDESSFSTNQISKKGWVKNYSSSIKSNLAKFTSISLISTINIKGDHYYVFVLGNNNEKTFLKYLELLVWKLN
jgi:hypothetical protein